MASKNIKKKKRFKVQKTLRIKNCKTKKLIIYIFVLAKLPLFNKGQLYKKHNGKIKVVSKTKKKEIPSIPKLL